MIFKN